MTPPPTQTSMERNVLSMTPAAPDVSSAETDMRILVVEDDGKIASFVVNGLKQSGFAVDRCADGEAAYEHASVHRLRRRDRGHHAAEARRAEPRVSRSAREGVRVPVIILSARASVDDRVRGLQAGGRRLPDQAVCVFRVPRARAVADPPRHAATEPTRLAAGDLTLDLLTREVTRAGERDRAAAAGVRPPRIFAAQCGPGADQDDDPGAHLGLQLRPADQRRGRARLPASEQG